jgi:putative IMPACT (imprinted ancient) family translation regulator
MSEMLSTLAQPYRHLEAIKKSRFLALAAPVESTEQALAFLREVSDPAATHNCWAWRIGQDYRFNDDGEPGGTAGRPILQAVEGQGIDRVMVVVTRWYGGIKLGAGGLSVPMEAPRRNACAAPNACRSWRWPGSPYIATSPNWPGSRHG